jgi:hypothetical protein
MFLMSYLSFGVIIFAALVAVKEIGSRWKGLLTIAYLDFAAMSIYWAHSDRVGGIRGIQ